MKLTTWRRHLAAGMALAIALAWSVSASAQSISGTIFNGSLWRENIQAPPGNGDGQGLLMLGLWNAQEGMFATPITAAPVTNATALPIAYGPYAYTIGPVASGEYLVMAWIDGNTNGLYDVGEPRGEAGVKVEASSLAGITLAVVDDIDGDTLPDWWEYHWFRFSPKPFEQAGGTDPDKDGLTCYQEYIISVTYPDFDYLNPANWDTDGDGIDDKWEVEHYSVEYGIGTHPCDPTDSTVDLDGDGLSNWQEYCGVDRYPPLQSGLYVNGTYTATRNTQTSDDLNPLDIDTDFDLLIDSFEAAWYDPAGGIDPKAGPLTDFPSATNVNTTVAAADPDNDGLSNYREQCLLAEFHQGAVNGNKWVWEGRVPFPYNSYYDVNSIQRRICLMSYGGANLSLGLDPSSPLSTSDNRAALRNHEWTDPTEGTGYYYVDEDIPPGHDTDDDWLPDGWEVEFNLNPRDDGMGGLWDNGPFGDPDNDNLLNIEEYLGQDGYRSATKPCVNGTGDETNPYQYNHRPDSTYYWRWYPADLLVNPITSPRNGTGISRVETMGSALPTTSLGIPDTGTDTDDDGIPDLLEMSPTNGSAISSPVHSCDPFMPRAAMITGTNGIEIPDPERETGHGIVPAGMREDLQRRDWTIECYVKLSGTNLTGDLFNFVTKAGAGSRIVYRLSLSNNIPRLLSQLEGGVLKSVQANALPTNKWVHLAGVWDHKKNSLGLYVDSLLFMASPSVGECFSRYMFPATNQLALAVAPNGSFTNRLLLDEVRIWGVARSADQISTFASRMPPTRNGDDVWIDTESSQYYTHADTVILNGGSLFDGEPGTNLPNVCKSQGNYWIDNGDNQYNAAIDTLLACDNSLKEGLAGTRVSNVMWNDKDGDGAFSRDSLLAYYRFDDGGSTAEDFARRAKSGLTGSTSEEFLFGDRGYALATNNFLWVTNDTPPIYAVDKRGVDDSDGDGMPDAWEMVWHLDPWDNGTRNESLPGMQDGPGGPKGDPDHDGLINLYEYWAGTNPQSVDSDGDGIFDAQEDRDGDGVLNITEQQLKSRPDMVDTDDDGYPDNIEQGMGSSPAEPADPATSRAVVLGGTPDDYLEVPPSTRQRLTDWTLEAWVNPSNAVDGAGTILRRVVQNTSNGVAMTYVMGLETNGSSLRLYAGYVWPDGRQFILKGGGVPATGTWTHVAARYNSLDAQLNLYTNGGIAATTNTFYDAPPVSGMGGETFLRLGEDYAGALDEVRIWSIVRDDNQILYNMSKVISGDDLSHLAHYFRFDDGQADTNGFPWSEFHQPGGLQDFTYSSDWNEQWRHAARIHGRADIIIPGAIVPPPSLRILLAPEAAKSAGAQWSVDGGSWQDSGATIQGLTPGEHSLIFKSVIGWMEPPSEIIVLTNGTATTVSRTYLQKAALTVNIEPMAVRDTGLAHWRIDGGAWMTSGTTISNLNPGAHTLEFDEVSGWVKPPLETVVLNPGQALAITRLYSIMYGEVSAILLPPAAIADGAQWRIDNGTWQNSGDSVGNLALTTHTVDFRNVPLWLTPASISVSLTNDTPVVLTGSYSRVTGLLATIQPAEAIADGALWRITGGNWTNSGAFLELSAGSYTVNFAALDGWLSPGAVTVTVVSQSVATVVGNYYRIDVFGGTPGTNIGQFTGPRGIALDASHRLFVADTFNSRIQRYDPMSRTWTNWGQLGTNAGQFNMPGGIAVDKSGNIFVADSNNNRVQKRTATNNQWRSWGGYGSGTGYFNGPSDVAVDSAGNLYVADLYNNRVQKLGTNGSWSVFVASGTTAGTVRNPKGILVDNSDNVYVSDDGTQTNGSSRIQKFNPSGTFLAQLGSSQPTQGQLRRPGGMALGTTNLYVADIDNSRVVASPSNTVWSTLLSSNVLDHAEDVAWDPRGFVYVADTGNNRILMVPATPGVESNKTVSFTGFVNPGTNASFTITWYGVLNWFYAIEYASALDATWQSLTGATNIAGQNMTTNFTDYSVEGSTSRFYRVLAY